MRASEMADFTRRTMTYAAFGNNDHRINGCDRFAKPAPCEKATSSTGGLVSRAVPATWLPPWAHAGAVLQLLQWAQCPI